MKTESFNNLSNYDKAHLLCEYGEYLSGLETTTYRISLYSLNDSYIEIYFNLYTLKTEKIEIASYSELDKYLNKLTLNIASI